MRFLLIALLLAACGGAEVDRPPSGPAVDTKLVDALGMPCTPPGGCPQTVEGSTVCGTDRFGLTCTAYCTDAVCQDPRTKCLDRVGLPRSQGYTGFCWHRCSDGCPAGTRCDTSAGICGPA